MNNAWETAKLPANYSRAKKAIADCVSVDECKAWKVKANMIASYARQYNDKTMLEDCYEIRNRAKRRMGELLTGTPQARGANQNIRDSSIPKVGRVAVAEEAGISERERKDAMRLAAMPREEFERNVKDPSLGQQKGKRPLPGTIRCPHCGGVIVL
jgi:hypothetical protein